MPSLLLIHPAGLSGENRGIFVQHVESMQWLLDGKRGWTVNAVDVFHPAFPQLALESDVVVIHMLSQREIESLIRLRRSRDLRTVFEISDNFLDIGDWVPRRHLLRSPLIRQQILFHARLADAVQVYSPGLLELFRQVNPVVTVLDPYVPLAPARREPQSGDAFIFGWGGTSSHDDDLARIAPVVSEFCAAHSDAVFSFMGDASMFARHFSGIPSAQCVVRPFGDYDRYLAFVRSLDVGLVPMRESAFNAARTDTKFATYAACGVASVLEDTPLHRTHAERAAIFRTPDELRDILGSLHHDRTRVADLASRAYEWAADIRGEERLRDQRDRFYRSLVDGSRVPGTQAVADTTRWSDRLAEASREKPEATLAAAEEVLRECADHAPAQWIAIRSLEASGRLDEALARLERVELPELYADQAAEMQVRLTRKLRPSEADEHFARVASPLARLRLQHHDQKDRAAYFRAVLEHQPYDFFALSGVIRQLTNDGSETSQLAELYERICLVAPETVPAQHRPASLARFLPA